MANYSMLEKLISLISWTLRLSTILFWNKLYFWCAEKYPEKSPEWYSRVITLLHGSVSTVGGLWRCKGLSTLTFTECSFTSKTGYINYILMMWSWGYFAFDLIWCLIYWPDHTLILTHHFCSLGAITVYLRKNNSGCTFPCTIALMEITNPLLQLRWFLKNAGYDKKYFFYFVEITYLSLFLSLRAIVGTYLIYKIMMAESFDMEAKVLSLALYAVSLGLVNDIIGFVLYKYESEIKQCEGYLLEMGIILDEQT